MTPPTASPCPYYNINLSIEPGEAVTFEFDATEDGVFSYYCTEFCSALHLEMIGYMLVYPQRPGQRGRRSQ